MSTITGSAAIAEKKEWDSDFFGINVGAVTIGTNEINNHELSVLAAGGFDLIYINSKTPVTFASPLFSDCKVELKSTAPEAPKACSNHVIPYNDTMDYPSLLSLSLQSGEYSRFKLDPALAKGEFALLYKQWLDNSINKKIANEVFVVQNQDQNAAMGFITLAIKNNYCEIGLLAVDSNYRRRGVGKDLIATAWKYALSHNLNELRVATQERNAEALEFYKAAGFEIFDRTYIYHYWPSDDTI